MILNSLILLPALAQSYAITPAGTQQSPSSASTVAELTPPGISAELSAAAPSASANSLTMATHASLREFVRTQMVDDFTADAMQKGGTLEFSMRGSEPVQASAPKVKQTVEVALSDQELSEQPAVSNVVLRAIVDENGVPRNVVVTQSAGRLVDKKAIAAVQEYRFTPAMVDNKPTWASVSIAIKIQKP
jgi:TonB family protein